MPNRLSEQLMPTQEGIQSTSTEVPIESNSRSLPPPPGRLARFVRRALSFPAVLMAGLIVITVATAASRFDDPDIWWQLRIGQIIDRTHSIPTTDLFSYTVFGHPWTAHEWLAQWSMYAVYSLGGYQGLMAWLCVFASLLLIAVFVTCRLQTGDDLVALGGALVAWLFATGGFAIRALMLGYLLLAIEILIIEVARTRGRRWLWLLPPIFVIWANCHPSYTLGLAVLVIYAVCSKIRGQWGLIVSTEDWGEAGKKTLWITLSLCIAALCINPVGARLLIYPFDAVRRILEHAPGVNAVEEWAPPSLNSVRALASLIVAGGIALVSLLRRSQLHLRDMLLTGLGLGMALEHQRMFFVFGVLVAPILCRMAGSKGKKPLKREHPILNAMMVAFGLAIAVWLFPSSAALAKQVREGSPVGATEFIRKQGLEGPMLNEYVFGGFLTWALPEHKVFIDGRADIYDWAGVFPEYGQWATLTEDPNILLDKYHIGFCILRKGAPLGRVIPHLAGWREVYSDDVAEVFTR